MLTQSEKRIFYKNLLDNTSHSFIQEFFTRFPNMLNSFMLSFVSHIFLSATTLAGQFLIIYSYSTLGLSLAVIMLTSQYYGKQDYDSMHKIFHTSLIFSFIMSVMFFITTFFFPKYVMTFLTNDSELIILGSTYLKFYSPVFIFSAFSKIYMAILKSQDKAKISTMASLSANIMNVFISFILVYGLFIGKGIGIKGAAIASSFSAFTEFLIILFYCLKYGKIKFSFFQLFHIDFYFIKEIFRYSIPIIFAKFAWSTSRAMQISLIGHMSRNIIDAYAFIKMLANITLSMIIGYSVASGIVIGHELGKANIPLAKKYGDTGLKIAAFVGLLSAAITFLLGFVGINLSGFNASLRNACFLMAFFYALMIFSGAFTYYLNNGIFSCGGEVEFIALIDVLNMWCIMLPLGLISFYVLKLPEIVVLFTIFSIEIVKFFPLYSHYKKYVWARDLTKNPWFLPIEGSFIDKYKRNFKLRLNIALTDLFTKRFENTTDFIFSLSKENYNTVLEELQQYLKNININDITSYKIILALEGLYTSSREYKETIKSANCDFNCDIGVKLKKDKVRLIYYDNGINLNKILNDKSKISIKVLLDVSNKLVYKRILNLNKIIIRINK